MRSDACLGPLKMAPDRDVEIIVDKGVDSDLGSGKDGLKASNWVDWVLRASRVIGGKSA